MLGMKIFNLICDMQFQAICFVFDAGFFFVCCEDGISRHNVRHVVMRKDEEKKTEIAQ